MFIESKLEESVLNYVKHGGWQERTEECHERPQDIWCVSRDSNRKPCNLACIKVLGQTKVEQINQSPSI